MSVKMRQHVEKLIASALIDDALKAGYAINIDNGGDTEELPEPSTDKEVILNAMFAADDDRLYFYKNGKAKGWVWLIYGNGGWDVISDYTTNLRHIMAGADAESKKWE